MSGDDPIDPAVLRQEARSAEAQLHGLAAVFHLAVRGVKEPETITINEVKLLSEAVLRHMKPSISARGKAD